LIAYGALMAFRTTLYAYPVSQISGEPQVSGNLISYFAMNIFVMMILILETLAYSFPGCHLSPQGLIYILACKFQSNLLFEFLAVLIAFEMPHFVPCNAHAK
jgi:hypothetical protein